MLNKNQIKKMFETFLKNQKDTFPEFYKQVKHLKPQGGVFTAVLLCKLNRNKENILEMIPELKKSYENNYDNKNVLYS